MCRNEGRGTRIDPVISSVVTTTSLQPREVAAPGSDITLSCSFPPSKNLNLNHLFVNWQRGESEVVHSYYYGRDQLERQSVVYKGRTHLIEDQLTGFPQPEVLWGGVMGSNTTMELDSRGRYELESEVTLRLNSTLTVTADLKLRVLDQSFTKSLTLHPPPEQQMVDVSPAAKAAGIGAPVIQEEPPSRSPSSVQSSCDRFVITLNSSQGFPQPDVWWTDSIGGDISNQSHSRIGLDSRGRYEVHSSMEVRPNGTLTIIVEIRLEVLNQSFTRSLILHPLPVVTKLRPAGRIRPVSTFGPAL
ncbi:hypothetical protein J4Q44_G00021990 [Coregonus suidteri]|uniref:Uncharacterized protein n=1 Tax=Coregonus suidteri TaxID=861788 RepID=A0AAN8R815_9TELE